MTQFIQWMDSTKKVVGSVFAVPQDPEQFENYDEIESDVDLQPHMVFDGTTFALPVDYVTGNAVQQVALMTTANAATFGMGDAFMSGLLDEADTAKFKAWAAYKLALSKVDLTQAMPAWPTVPAST